MGKKLTNEQIERIITSYQNDDPVDAIGKAAGISGGSVCRILRKRGIPRTQAAKKVSQADINKIIAMYTGDNQISSEIIADNLRIAGSTVCRILKKNGIPIRPSEQNKRKYDIKQDYFESIDDEEKAYFLGFLYADGGLSKKGWCIKVELHPQDRDVLEKFSNAIYGFTKISIDRRDKDGQITDYFYTPVYSKKMHQDLTKLGCPNNKAFTITFPTFLDKHLVRHFIRGYFDGDGCICVANHNRPVVDFTSNIDFIVGLIEYIETTVGIKCGKMGQRYSDTNTRNIQISGFTAIKHLLDHLYNDASIFMDRKRAKYYEMLNQLTTKNSKNVEKQSDRSKYGTTYIPTYNEKILTTDNLKLMTSEEKSEVAKFLVKFYRDNGFPYSELTNVELIREFNALKDLVPNSIESEKILSLYNQAGIPIFKHFSHHYYEVSTGRDGRKKSMLDSFNDDTLLHKVVMNRLNYNYNMTGNMLKQGLANSKIAFKASIFFPAVAKFIYSKYTKENDVIYDYAMGFGQRLLGAMSLPHRIKYVGIDPLNHSVSSNQRIYDFLNDNIPFLDKDAEIIQAGSEEYCDEKYIGKVNVAFSSPPYFNLEKYSDETSQAYAIDDYYSFISGWWNNTVSNIDKMLANDGLFILNMKEKVQGFPILQDMSDVILKRGFEKVDEYKMKLTRNTSFQNKSGVHKYEPIVVFARR